MQSVVTLQIQNGLVKFTLGDDVNANALALDLVRSCLKDWDSYGVREDDSDFGKIKVEITGDSAQLLEAAMHLGGTINRFPDQITFLSDDGNVVLKNGTFQKKRA